ncbi:type II secretion system F family protein [Bryobacter aggregatus]|uniref:type II secretion system F family protein n=1 Tax=Bryobacter aggregatus TaxID=360054 RepID=UPI00068F706D|nr:type II secretion system F family protein [Bryobacter aggregatus]
MSGPFLLLLIFTATFAFVVAGLYFASGWFKTEALVEGESDGFAGRDGEPLLLRTETVSSISFWATLLERFRFVPNLRRLISEAGLSWSVGRFTAMMLLAGASMGVILSRLAWLPLLGVLCGAVLAMLAPFFYVRSKRQKRFLLFEENFPDALDTLGRAMRAGHALAAGIELVAYEAAQPVSGEFRIVLEEWKLGRSWDQALDHLVQRIPLVSVSLFVAAVRMQSRTGGKLHEILTRISEGVRDSGALEGEVRAISAHGKLTGAVLTVLPIGIAVMLHSTAPGYLDILNDNPVGRYMVVAAVILLIAAHFVIRKILDIRI